MLERTEGDPARRPGRPRRGAALARAVLAPRRRPEIICAALLLLMGANLLSVVARKGLTIDEVSGIPAGYYHLVAGDFQINSEHPPLAKMLSALPLLFIQPEEPPLDSVRRHNFTQRTVGVARLFWDANDARFHAISFWARVPFVLLTLLLGALVFLYARTLFGARAAVFAVALYSLEPNVLAHGRVGKDLHAALAYFLFFAALHLYAASPGWRRALLLGLACALAPLFKFSMAVVAPVALAVGACLVVLAPRRGRRRSRVFLQLTAAALVALILINAAYYFQHPPLTGPDAAWAGSNIPATRIAALQRLGVDLKLLPTYFLFGIFATLAHNQTGHPASLLGMYGRGGWWYYFPVAFALKTTLPSLLLSSAALGWSAWRLLRRREAVFVALLAPVALYTVMSAGATLNIGVRHFLPVFPFLFILGGALLDRLLRAARTEGRRRAAFAAVALVIGGAAVEAFRAYPDYIPYLNQLTWGRPGWQYLSDSNVEWGDDAPGLAAYLRARGETRVRAAFLGGEQTLGRHGVEYLNLFRPHGEELPRTRYVAIGASLLNGSTVDAIGRGGKDFFDAYRARRPEAVIGGSIYLYREEE